MRLLKLRNISGLTFVEVMVTVAVLSYGLVSIYKAFFLTLDYTNHLTNRFHAMTLLSNKIEVIQKFFELNKAIPMNVAQESDQEKIGKKNVDFTYEMEIKNVGKLEDIFLLDMSIHWQERGLKKTLKQSCFVASY